MRRPNDMLIGLLTYKYSLSKALF